MEKMNAVAALAALSQENRLDIYRLLVQAGPDGMAAGEVAATLGIAPNTLSFHFDRLRHAGLVSVARQGRSLIYAARYETMNALLGYLTENCCGGKPDQCAPAACKPVKPTRSSKRETVSWALPCAPDSKARRRALRARHQPGVRNDDRR